MTAAIVFPAVPPTPVYQAGRADLQYRLALPALSGLVPAVRAATFGDPDLGAEAGLPHATLWLDHGDTGGVDRWVTYLSDRRGRVIAAAGLGERVYEGLGAAQYRVYRAAVVFDGWHIGINCQVPCDSAVTQ